MTNCIEISAYYPEYPLIKEVTKELVDGKVIAYPTDSGYALGCKLGMKTPLVKISKLRQLPKDHHFTLVCRDLSEIAQYAWLDNSDYRLLKRCTPGHFTFLLKATRKVSFLMSRKGKKTVGIRIPKHEIPLALSAQLNEPLVSTSLILPGQTDPLVDPDEVIDQLANLVDVIIISDYIQVEPTTIVDLNSFSEPVIIRQGAGKVDFI